jgi:hypothetical protein
MSAKPASPKYDHVEILRIQLCGGFLRDEAVMRYIAFPGYCEEIVSILEEAMKRLYELTHDDRKCPNGWEHVGCKCHPIFNGDDRKGSE